MGAYQRLVKDLASKFEKIGFERISREMNIQADRLAHAASMSVEDMRVATVELLSSPSIPMDPGVMQIDAEEETWVTPIMNYLTKGTQPNNPIEARKLQIKAAREELNPIGGPWPFARWGIDIVGPLPTTVGGKKFVLLATNYFTKAIVTDNGTQFDNCKFRSYCEEKGLIQQFSSRSYPQGNGQAEKTNRTIFDCLKRRLEQRKGKWAEELPNVTLVVESNDNERQLAHNLDMLEEQREAAALRLANYQNQAANYFNKRVWQRKFKVGAWILRKVMENTKGLNAGKFGRTWEGPYEVTEVYGKWAYMLRHIESGQYVPRPWNAIHLRKYFI
ncbi:unnamed protein product [Prunus armeniaca]